MVLTFNLPKPDFTELNTFIQSLGYLLAKSLLALLPITLIPGFMWAHNIHLAFVFVVSVLDWTVGLWAWFGPTYNMAHMHRLAVMAIFYTAFNGLALYTVWIDRKTGTDRIEHEFSRWFWMICCLYATAALLWHFSVFLDGAVEKPISSPLGQRYNLRSRRNDHKSD